MVLIETCLGNAGVHLPTAFLHFRAADAAVVIQIVQAWSQVGGLLDHSLLMRKVISYKWIYCLQCVVHFELLQRQYVIWGATSHRRILNSVIVACVILGGTWVIGVVKSLPLQVLRSLRHHIGSVHLLGPRYFFFDVSAWSWHINIRMLHFVKSHHFLDIVTSKGMSVRLLECLVLKVLFQVCAWTRHRLLHLELGILAWILFSLLFEHSLMPLTNCCLFKKFLLLIPLNIRQETFRSI
jgi:hypothetical protein